MTASKLVQHLHAHVSRTQRMLTPGLGSSTGAQASSRLSPVLAGFGGAKYKASLPAIKFLNKERLGNLRPDLINLLGRSLPARFANSRSLLRLRPAYATGGGLWPELERPLPLQPTASPAESTLEPGTLRQGSIIQKFQTMPKPGQSLESFKEQVGQQARPRPTSAPEKPRPAKPGPNTRLFSKVEEISGRKSEPAPEEQPTPPAQPPAPAADTLQPQRDVPRSETAPAPIAAPRADVPVPPADAAPPPPALAHPPKPASQEKPEAIRAPVEAHPAPLPGLPRAIPSSPQTTETPRAAPLKARATPTRKAAPAPRETPATRAAPVSAPKPVKPTPAPSRASSPPAATQSRQPMPSGAGQPVVQRAPDFSSTALPVARPLPARPPEPEATPTPAARLPEPDVATDSDRKIPSPSEERPAVLPAREALTPSEAPRPAPAVDSPVQERLAYRKDSPGQVRFLAPQAIRPTPSQPLVTARPLSKRQSRPAAQGKARPAGQPAALPGLEHAATRAGRTPEWAASPPLPVPAQLLPFTAPEMPVARLAATAAHPGRESPSRAPGPSLQGQAQPTVHATPAAATPESPPSAPGVARKAGPAGMAAGTVQRALDLLPGGEQPAPSSQPGGAESAAPEPPDLDQIAESVLPLVKRILETEMERTVGWPRPFRQ